MNRTLRASSKYRKFAEERNKALERIEQHAQLDISRLVHSALEKVEGFVSYLIVMKSSPYTLRRDRELLSDRISQVFGETDKLVIDRIMRMRRAVYTLSYFGELEAISRATNPKKTPHILPFHFAKDFDKAMDQNTVRDRHLETQTMLTFYDLRDRILRAYSSAIAVGKEGSDILAAVQNVFPKIQFYVRPPRALKPVREADNQDDNSEKKEFTFYHDLTNDEDWDLAVQAYKDTELSPTRFDKSAEWNPESGTMQYSWELEQDLTDDFVQQVRDGQVAAANEMGIKDFVWVAVIDDKTCEVCCLPRSGKLVSEIEKMLESGELDDQCDATVPPAHPNCRCDIAPVASTDEVDGPDWKSFNDWLES